jgi:hypothetical protein
MSYLLTSMLSQSTSSIAALLTGWGILTCGGRKQVPWAAVAVAVAAEAAVQLNRKPGDTLATGDANLVKSPTPVGTALSLGSCRELCQ